jgi:hypothetical protein
VELIELLSCRKGRGSRPALDAQLESVLYFFNMADEKSSGSKNTILWIITVVLVGLAIFLYKR